jgi:hypothetical protein
LSDHVLIQEFAGLDYEELIQKLRQLGDEAASAIQVSLHDALDSYQHIIFLTHVPPFKEACWYQGRVGGEDWLPFFTCKAVGEVLYEVMQEQQKCQLTVLCGHTHNAGVAQILPNLRVLPGSAEYGAPHVQQVLDIASVVNAHYSRTCDLGKTAWTTPSPASVPLVETHKRIEDKAAPSYRETRATISDGYLNVVSYAAQST